jgi:hypothetical protein
MAETVIRRLRVLLLVAGLVALPFGVIAHRLDEYLQATLVTIEPGEVRLQLNLTPGVDIANQVLALIDRNRDGLISSNEAAAYSELLKRDLVLRLDQHKIALKPTAVKFPEVAELRTGWGVIQIEFSGSIGPLTAGTHKLGLKNRHLPALSVYLFNAALPGPGSLQITAQKRNRNQSNGEIEFSVE